MAGIKGQKSGGFGGRTGDGIEKTKSTFQLFPESIELVKELRAFAKVKKIRFNTLINKALYDGIKNILKKD